MDIQTVGHNRLYVMSCCRECYHQHRCCRGRCCRYCCCQSTIPTVNKHEVPLVQLDEIVLPLSLYIRKDTTVIDGIHVMTSKLSCSDVNRILDMVNQIWSRYRVKFEQVSSCTEINEDQPGEYMSIFQNTSLLAGGGGFEGAGEKRRAMQLMALESRNVNVNAINAYFMATTSSDILGLAQPPDEAGVFTGEIPFVTVSETRPLVHTRKDLVGNDVTVVAEYEYMDLTWPRPRRKADLAKILAHELGHILNLPHRDCEGGCLMGLKEKAWKLNETEVGIARERAIRIRDSFKNEGGVRARRVGGVRSRLGRSIVN